MAFRNLRKILRESFQRRYKADLTQDMSLFAKVVRPFTCSVTKQPKTSKCCCNTNVAKVDSDTGNNFAL